MNIELIGEKLKKIRLERGLTLEDLQKKTKVHLNILKAIEGESLTNLSPIYLKGFIKIYCKALGLEPKDYIPYYKESSASVILGAHKNKDSFLRNVGMKMNFLKPNKNIRKVIIIGLTTLVFLIVLFRVVGCFSSRRTTTSTVPVLKISQPKKQEPIQSAIGSNIPKEASGGVRLVVSSRENCLVFVKVDGKVVFHRVLEKGRSNNWKAKERIDLSLGNASAVEIVVNGQRFKDLGRKGQPLRNIVITEKEGLNIPR
ncbi:MAG: RodZ domain-containing protein [Candidatus Omnitrophota bacterium]|jgi:cytoskeletal protein RodZ